MKYIVPLLLIAISISANAAFAQTSSTTVSTDNVVTYPSPTPVMPPQSPRTDGIIGGRDYLVRGDMPQQVPQNAVARRAAQNVSNSAEDNTGDDDGSDTELRK